MSKKFDNFFAKDYNCYLFLIEAEDPDFYDFLTFPVQEYFVMLMAKKHNDLFGMSDVEETIQFCSMSESFIFNRSDWNQPSKATRPKWPG